MRCILLIQQGTLLRGAPHRYSFTSHVHPAQLRAYDPAAGKYPAEKAVTVKNAMKTGLAERI